MHGCSRQEVTSESEGEAQRAAISPRTPRLVHHKCCLHSHPPSHLGFFCLLVCFRKAANLAVIYQTWAFILPKESDQKLLGAAEMLRINLPWGRKVHVGKLLQSHSGESCRAAVLRFTERPLVLRIIIR